MNVHITCTLEYSERKLDEIVTLLSSIPGAIKFSKGKLLTPSQFKRINAKLEDINSISGLTFDEYFDLVQGYRETLVISDNDFVILISSIRNTRNWFSAFNKKRIYEKNLPTKS